MIVMESHTNKLNSLLLISCVYKLSSQPFSRGPLEKSIAHPCFKVSFKNENPS